MLKEFKVIVDIEKIVRNPVYTVNSNDLDTFKLIVTVNKSGIPADLTNVTPRIAIKKPDGNTVFLDGIVTGLGVCEFLLTTQAYVVSGSHKAEIMLYDGTTKVAVSNDFSYAVVKGIMNDNTVVSANEWQSIEKVLVDGPIAVDNAIDAAANAQQVASENKTKYLPAVATVADRDTTYPAPIHGDTVRVTDESKTYRYDSVSGWVLTDQYNPTAIDEVNAKIDTISEQLVQSANVYFDDKIGEYVNLGKFWDNQRTGKKYTVEFNQYGASPSSDGIKKDDNVGLFCEPSTNTYKGRNDYENIGLFRSIDVNAYVDANDDYHVTAIKGDGRFKADGTNGDVYVMAMPGYIKRYLDSVVWGFTYSDVQYAGFEILDEAVKPDGTIRPYLLHAKYAAGKNPLDGLLASISGVYPEYDTMDHNSQITKFHDKGLQYSGKTTHDDYYVQMMLWLKYATMNSENAMKGAVSYYNQYVASVFETNATRIIISNSNATGIEVGSCVSIGDFNGSTQTNDRQNAINYNIANRVMVLSKEPLADEINTVINLDVATAFTTTATTTITTYPWISGACDNVLGQDGSPTSNSSGREPFILNGIEMMVGGYEVLANIIINNNNTDTNNYKIEVYANYNCKTFATTITTDYDFVGLIAQTNNSWSYLTKTETKDLHPSLILPIATGGTSSTGYGDGIYTNSPTSGTREWLSLGYPGGGSGGGLRCFVASGGLASSSWGILGRLSATGRSRRRALG
ncbi:BppU family phage baseplate upper protein [Mesobacillus stamsii]|uniref:BppU N-terminal domain-containing protein n=1 Tax=Mesobacillus stamsii TaxID=225347 RepID=A0ABU0FWD8_9BACI|nr:BppU family phage baseplate upper protein [Mesobacillus stamsii]MDQ0414243.1 hypothetical protein [Mesobacillus stamsii]